MSPINLQLPSGGRTFHGLILDFTGTLSLDGILLPGVASRLQALSRSLQITVLTADTFGTAKETLAGLPLEVRLIRDGAEKAEAVASLDPGGIIAIGNGRNDVAMLAAAELGIAILGPEGVASELLTAADVVVSDINDALDLILHPLRLKATLRD
ncbi:MAG: HAD hydrolase family protein [Gemmatimonadota bacterium]